MSRAVLFAAIERTIPNSCPILSEIEEMAPGNPELARRVQQVREINSKLRERCVELLEAIRGLKPHAAVIINDNHPDMHATLVAIAKAEGGAP